MNLHLAGQTVAVIGAAQGIGRAIARAFAGEGCRLCLCDRNETMEPVGEDDLVFAGDVARTADLEAFAKAAGPVIHHVIYAVGAGSGKFGFPFWNVDPEDWARVLDLNLTGAVRTAQAFTPALLAAREQEEAAAENDPPPHPSMLFLVSVAGQIGSQTDPPYSAAKAGLINFMQCAAKDFAPHGIRANALSPGMVKTALNESVWAAGQAPLPPEARQDYETWATEKIRAIAPLGQWQTAEEMAAMAAFLASHHARNITGQTINVDGGQVMR